MSASDDEVVEMEVVEEAPEPAPRRRGGPRGGPRRSPVRGGVRRTQTTDSADSTGSGGGGLRRTQTTNGAEGRQRRLPARTKSSDGSGMAGRMMPRRTKSTDGSILPARGSSPKRTQSGFGGPRRTKSSDGGMGGGVFRRGGRRKEKAGANANELNIFGADMVSTDKILEQIQGAKEDSNICKLELEDFFVADRKEPDLIPTALKELLETDDRPWELVHYIDDIIDGSMYADWLSRKKRFLKILDGVCGQRLIPESFHTKICVTNGVMTVEEMVELLAKFEKDKSVIFLTVKCDQVCTELIDALTKLFDCDKRKWEAVTLQLSGGSTAEPGSEEHNQWAAAMQNCSEQMQQVAKARGIRLA